MMGLLGVLNLQGLPGLLGLLLRCQRSSGAVFGFDGSS